MQSSSTPVVKYYKPDTCYDGLRDVEKKEAKFRRYPDEYLIAQLLNKYLLARFEKLAESNRKIIVLTEDWFSNSGDRGGRDGSMNTTIINEIIYSTIAQLQEAAGEDEDTLILVPFLYGNHHPGIAIDLKNKQAIYVDPLGSNQSSNYRETSALISELLSREFKIIKLLAPQQRGDDGTSCGPILTNTMFRFIEEYMANGCITTDGFEAPRKKLATDRMFQMYINNTIEYKENTENIHEIMLADPSLWQAFLNENPVNDEKLSSDIMKEFQEHQAAIQKMGLIRNPLNLLLIQLIQLLQSRVTECIMLNPADKNEQLDRLVATSRAMRAATQPAQLNEFEAKLKAPLSLFDHQRFETIQQRLRLDPPVKSKPNVSREPSSSLAPQPLSPIMNSPFERLGVIPRPPIPSLQHMGSSSQLLDSNDTPSKQFFTKHYLLAAFLKWSFTGLVAAAAFYFTFGFAVVPYVGAFLAQQGLYAIPIVGSVLAAAGGVAWNVTRSLYKRSVAGYFTKQQQPKATDVSEEIDFGDDDSPAQSPQRQLSRNSSPTRKSPPASSTTGNGFGLWANSEPIVNRDPLVRSAFERKR